MKSDRIKATLYVGFYILIIPFIFKASQGFVETLLSAYAWDDDLHFRRFFIQFLSLGLVLYLTRFLSGAIEECRKTHGMNPLFMAEIISRALCVGLLSLAALPASAFISYQILSSYLDIWRPLCWLLSGGFITSTFFWTWRLQNRRMTKVEKVYRLEALKLGAKGHAR